MIPSIPNSDARGWVIGPASRCVLFVADQMQLLGTLKRAVIALASQGPLITTARQAAKQAGSPTAPFDALLQEQTALKRWAQEIINSGYHEINVPSLVACWSALEVAVEDTLVLLLVRWPPTVSNLEANGIDLQRQLAGGITEDSATRAVKTLERKLRSEFAAGPAMVEMLRVVGFGVRCPQEQLERLTELNAVRNCILHRGAVCDARTAGEAPGLELEVGQSIHVPEELMEVYLRAVSAFAQALIAGAAQILPATVGGDA